MALDTASQVNFPHQENPMSEFQVERHGSGGAVQVITINRPEQRNAINREVSFGVCAALDELDADPALRVGVLTGAGGTFCSGLDLKAFLRGEQVRVPGRGLLGLLFSPPVKPLIAAVEGQALAGGFEAVLACDLVVAARDARFGLPEARRGLVAAAGGLVRLPRLIPPRLAMELALTGEPVSAELMHHHGLVNRLTDSGEALAGAMQLAEQVLRNAPLSVQTSKAVITRQQDWLLDRAWAEQEHLTRPVLDSEDAREGAAAFVQKRPPSWAGR